MSEEVEEEQPKKDRWYHHMFDGCFGCSFDLFVIALLFVGVPFWWYSR